MLTCKDYVLHKDIGNDIDLSWIIFLYIVQSKNLCIFLSSQSIIDRYNNYSFLYFLQIINKTNFKYEDIGVFFWLVPRDAPVMSIEVACVTHAQTEARSRLPTDNQININCLGILIEFN